MLQEAGLPNRVCRLRLEISMDLRRKGHPFPRQGSRLSPATGSTRKGHNGHMWNKIIIIIGEGLSTLSHEKT